METTKHAGGIIPKLLLAAAVGLVVLASLGQVGEPPLQLLPNFADPVLFATGAITPRGVARGDIDGDGDMDLVVAGSTAAVQNGTATVSVFLNTDDWSPTSGGFEAPIVLPFDGPGEDCDGCFLAVEIVLTQIDGDIYPDIAVTTNGSSGRPQLVVFITDPSPPAGKKVGQVFTRYAYQLSSAFTYAAKGLIARDLNNSGRNDFAIATDSVLADPNILSAVFIGAITEFR